MPVEATDTRMMCLALDLARRGATAGEATADPVSLALLAVPLYGLYELGILLVRITPRDEGDTLES